MKSRSGKINFVLNKTNQEIEKLFRHLALYEKTIHAKSEQLNTLERYKLEYSEKHLYQGIQSPALIKHSFDFINMLDKTMTNIQSEIEQLKKHREQYFSQLEKLNLKKDAISKYLDKIIFEEQFKENKIEQSNLDEISLMQYAREIINENENKN